METGAYYRVNNQVKTSGCGPIPGDHEQEAGSTENVVTRSFNRRQSLRVIPGEHSKFVVHDDRPNFYFRPEKQERFGIIRITPKKTSGWWKMSLSFRSRIRRYKTASR